MAFLDIPEAERLEMGIHNGMIRISTGLEDSADLIADLDIALACI
jgi:cystathionine beta-lyase/cystathionine gamma-synthase